MYKNSLAKKVLLSIVAASVVGSCASAFAEESGSIILNEDKVVTGADLVITATDKGSDEVEGQGMSYGLAVVDGQNHTLSVDDSKTITINNSLGETTRNYGIVLNGSGSSLVIDGDVDLNVSGKDNTQVRVIRNNGDQNTPGTLNINGNTFINAISEKGYINSVDTWDGGTTNFNGDLTISAKTDMGTTGLNTINGGNVDISGNLSISNVSSGTDASVGIKLGRLGQDKRTGSINVGGKTQIDIVSDIGRIVGIENYDSNGGKISFGEDFTLKAENGKNYNQWFQGILSFQSTTEFNGNAVIELKNNSENVNGGKHVAGVHVECNPGNTYDSVVNFNGENTNITVDSLTNATGVYVSGEPGQVNFTGDNVLVDVKVTGDVNNDFAYGIESRYGGNVNSDANMFVNVDSKNDNAIGIMIHGGAENEKNPDWYNGNADFKGDVTVTASGKRNVIGIYNDAKTEYDGIKVNDVEDGKLNIGGDTKISVKSTNGDAVGFYVSGEYSENNVKGNVYVETDGKNNIAVLSEEKAVINLGDQDKIVQLIGDVKADNNGTVTLQGSNNIVKGTIKVDNNGTVNLSGNNAVYNIENIVASNNGLVNIGANTVINVDSQNITGEGKYLVDVSNSGNLTFDDVNTSKIVIANAKSGETYNIVNGDAIDEWSKENISADNFLLEFKEAGDNSHYIITTQYGNVAEKFDGDVVISNVMNKTLQDGEPDAAYNFFNDVAKNNTDKEAMKSAFNSAANIGELGGTSHGTYSMSNIMTDAVADHLSLATHGEQDKDVWAHYIHNKENVSGLALGGVDGNYDAQYNGIVVGSDLYKNGKATVGVALSYAEGNIDGSTLAARTSNDAEYYGASIYGRIDNGDSAVLGDISYLHSKNDIEQTNSGKTITATPKADAFSVGVKAEQVFNAGAAKFVPYAGLRYMHLGVGNYTDSLGMGYNSDEQNLWLLPVGVTYSQDIKAGSWTIRPVVEAGYVWTMGDRDTQQTVSLNGASDGFGFDVADSGSFISRFALEAENANVTYGLGYEYQNGDTVKANKWMANVNFSF